MTTTLGSRRRTSVGRTRSSGQSLVEFGLVALLFTMLLMGVVDFAILLNGWLGVSSSARDIARQAAVGFCPSTSYLPTPAPGGTCAGSVPPLPAPSALFIQGVDKTVTNAITVTMHIYSPDMATLYNGSSLLGIYPTGTCTTGTCLATAHPQANDAIVITVVAKIQVVTPLVRPFFGCSGTSSSCPVSITSRTVLRYEGLFI